MEICWQDGEHSQNQYVLTQQHFRVLVLACSTLMWDCGLFKDHSNSTNHYRLSDRLMNCSIMLAIANHKHWHFKFCNWSLTTKFIIKKNEKKKFFFGLNSLSPPPLFPSKYISYPKVSLSSRHSKIWSPYTQMRGWFGTLL